MNHVSSLSFFGQPGTGKVLHFVRPNKPGQVEFLGNLWLAELLPGCQAKLTPNEKVLVVGLIKDAKNSRLIITPES